MEGFLVLGAVVFLLLLTLSKLFFPEKTEPKSKGSFVRRNQERTDSNREHEEHYEELFSNPSFKSGGRYIYDEGFTCPDNCAWCYKAVRKLSAIYNYEILEAGHEFLFVDEKFGVAVNNNSGIATFFSLLDEDNFIPFPFKESYPGVSHVINEAWTFEDDHILIGLYPNYAILFKAYPPVIEMATFPLRYIIHPKTSLKACCFSELPSLILNYSGPPEPILFQLYPVGSVPNIKLVSIGSHKEEILPEDFHTPLLDILLFNRSDDYGTGSFGRVLEVLIEEKNFSKEDIWSTLLFFYAHPSFPLKDVLRVASKYLSSEELDAVLTEAAKQNRKPVDKAFIFRILAELSYDRGNYSKALSYAKQALRLDDKVGVKRLISKLEKQLNSQKSPQ